MSDRNRIQLKAIGELFDGPHATPRRISKGPYFLNISSLNRGRLELAQSDHVTESDFEKWTKRVTPQGGDLLFSYETRLGEAALMPEGVRACLGRRMALIRPNRAVVDPAFLLYLYLSPGFQRLIEQHTIHGATVNRIPLISMPEWEITLPELTEQRAIAEVLGAFDDKIAANTRLAATAWTLADQWFETYRSRSSVRPLGEISTIVLGGTPSRARPEYWTGGTIPWLNSGKANEDRIATPSEYITHEALANSAAKMMPVGSTLIAITGATLGQVARLEIEACGNQSLVGVWASTSALTDWLHFAIRASIPDLLKRATGAAQQHVSKGDVVDLEVPMLGDEDLNAFGEIVSPILAVATAADLENRTLAATRDTLLPPLMSGELRVRDVDAAPPEVLS